MPIAHAATRLRALDLHQPSFERHHRPELDAFAHRSDRRQTINRKTRTDQVEVRVGTQNQRRGICDMKHRRSHPRAGHHIDCGVKYAKLRVSDRTLRVAGIGEQRAHTLESHRRSAPDIFDNGGYLRRHHPEPGCATVNFNMNRKIIAACGSRGAIEYSDHRRIEHKRRHLERDNLGRLLGEKTCLQINAAIDARVSQLARLVKGRDSEMPASFFSETSRDRHGSMPIRIGLHDHHQLSMRRHRA